MGNRIKIVLRKLFRYKLISIFFIISQIVVYLSVFGALGIYNKAYAKEQDKLDGMYKNRISMDVVTIKNMDIFTYAGMDVNEGNVLVAGRLSLAFLEQGHNNRTEVIIKSNEELPYPIISGRLPGSKPEDVGKRLIALGREKYKNAYEKDGKKYVTIESEVYEVVGVIGSERSDYWDYKVVMNISCMGRNALETMIRKGNYTIEISSNSKELDNAYKELYSNIHSVDGQAVIKSKKVNSLGDNYALESLQQKNMKVNILVYIFCIFNCMLMSEFWIIQRRKEIAVRKVCGMTDKQIICGIVGDMLSLCIVSLVIFVFGAVLANMITGTQYIIVTPVTLMGVLLAMTIIIALAMAYPIYKIMRIEPAKVLGNGD